MQLYKEFAQPLLLCYENCGDSLLKWLHICKLQYLKLSKSSLWYENTFSIHIKTWILYTLIYGGSIFFIFHKKSFPIWSRACFHIVGIFIRRSILSLVWLRLLLIFFMKIMQYVMKNKVVTIFVFRLKYRIIYQSKYLQMM